MGEHHGRVAEAAEEAKKLALAALKKLGCRELELPGRGLLHRQGTLPLRRTNPRSSTRLKSPPQRRCSP